MVLLFVFTLMIKTIQLIFVKNTTHLKPAKEFNSVVLPAPLPPNIAVKCPDLKHPLTPLNITLFSIN